MECRQFSQIMKHRSKGSGIYPEHVSSPDEKCHCRRRNPFESPDGASCGPPRSGTSGRRGGAAWPFHHFTGAVGLRGAVPGHLADLSHVFRRDPGRLPEEAATQGSAESALQQASTTSAATSSNPPGSNS